MNRKFCRISLDFIERKMIKMAMTVSISKGNQNESSIAHNDRKTLLKTEEDKKKFYSKTGHLHIRSEYTHLNEDLKTDSLADTYNKYFEKAVEDYNAGQKRKSRKIGKGETLTKDEKAEKIVMLTLLYDYKKLKSKKKQENYINSLASEYQKPFKELLKLHENENARDIGKQLTQVKKAKTPAEAYLDKIRHGKQTRPVYEFVVQLGNATDYNKTNDAGQLVDKNGNVITDNSEKRSKRFVSLDREDKNGVWQQSKRVLEKYYETFEKRNKYLKISNASIHMDEASPHLHFDVVPVADVSKSHSLGSKGGHNKLSLRASFNTALDCQGFERDSKDNKKQFNEWHKQEVDALADIMQEIMHVERKKGVTNHLKNFREYKDAQAKVAEKNDELAIVQDAVDAQNERFKQNKAKLDDLDNYNTLVSNSKKQLKTNENTLKTQNTQISENQAKLDDLSDYDTLIKNKKNTLKTLKNEQKDLEDAKTTAEQEKEDNQKKIDEQRKRINKQVSIYQSNKKVLSTQETQISTNREVLSKYNISITDAQNKLRDAQNAQQEAENSRDETISNIKEKGLEEAKKAQASFIQSLQQRENAVAKKENAFYKLKRRFLNGFFDADVITHEQVKIATNGFKKAKEEKGFVKRYFKRLVRATISIFENYENADDISNLLEDYQNKNDEQPIQTTKPKIKQQNDNLEF